MTANQMEIVNALKQVRCLPGTWDKRFIKSIVFAEALTLNQDEWIYRLLFKYRRQLPGTYSKFSKHPLCGPKKKEAHP